MMIPKNEKITVYMINEESRWVRLLGPNLTKMDSQNIINLDVVWS